MRDALIPCTNFPTTILFLGTKPTLFSHIKAELNPNYRILFTSNPLHVVKNLRKLFQQFDPYCGFLTKTFDPTRQTSIDFNRILEALDNPARFHMISSILIEDQFNWIDMFPLIEVLDQLPITKIVVRTNHHTKHKTPIRYLFKTPYHTLSLEEVDGFERLFQLCKEANHHHHQQMTLQAFGRLHTPIKLSQTYQRLFNHFKQVFKLIEYYQVDENGSYVGFNQNGEIFWLAMMSENERALYLEIAKTDVNHQPLYHQLMQKTHLLFLPQETDKQLSPRHWPSFCFPIHGMLPYQKENYFYTFVENQWFSLEKAKINARRLLSQNINCQIQNDVVLT